MSKSMIRGVVIGLIVGLQQVFAFDIVPTPGDSGGVQFVKCERDYVTLIALSNGSMTVDGSGQIDILLVGGGGGGGLSNGDGGGAGGGAGGFVYKQSFDVTSGTYKIIVGEGGAARADGGDSEAFGLIAHGGGHGADQRNTRAAGSGGSGGGATAPYGGTSGDVGEALGTDDNCGHVGGSAANYRRAGGGGGAGEAGHVSVQYGGGGGKGKVCSITGRAVWYAGGGAGTFGSQDRGWQVNETTGDGVGGLGGGGNAGCKGEDGLGGGGGGEAAGGSGVVIVRYRRSEPDVDADDFNIVSSDTTKSWVLDDGLAMVFGRSGQLTVTGGGYVDVMLVGGGGGGGLSESEGGGAGGGAGGFVYRQGVYVGPGTYSVEIGAGGAIGANGGVTKALGFVAYGGGCGAENRNRRTAGDGGSGGGQTEDFSHNKSEVGQAVYSEEFNEGHAGGTSESYMQTGGGGGAGSAGGSVSGYGGFGGTGVICRITGEDVWYAGGGAGTCGAEDKGGWKTNAVTCGGCGGFGGGGNAGCAGTDGLGGGGGGDAKGGSGVFIVRFAKPGLVPECYDDAMGGVVTQRRGYRIHTFTEPGTFTMPSHAGKVDILLVGGGGGGGLSNTEGGAGGGGAGGLVYKESVFVREGEYAITVGQGGAVGVNGGASTALGLIAHGGGCGAENRARKAAGDGGSGGGATAAYGSTSEAVGEALGTDDNLGHNGGIAPTYRRAGGGGGAGEAGHVSVQYGGGGGNGVSNAISGKDVWYAGGGAGTYGAEDKSGWQVVESTGDGKGGLGGGGNAGCAGTDGLGGGGGGDAKGGNGVVIIRYKKPPQGLCIIVR